MLDRRRFAGLSCAAALSLAAGRGAAQNAWPSRFVKVVVPFAPESEMSGIGETGFHPVLWYRRTFTAPATPGRVLLHFGAVDYRASVWVNGDLVATHEGGHTPFSADMANVQSDGPSPAVRLALPFRFMIQVPPPSPSSTNL